MHQKKHRMGRQTDTMLFYYRINDDNNLFLKGFERRFGMIFTEQAEHLLALYNDSGLNIAYGEILEIPEFVHDNCRIVVTFKPSDYTNNIGIMAVKIRTSLNVTFTPFYLKNRIGLSGNRDVEFTPFFDMAEYMALKDEIILADGNSTIPLFEDIGEHICACNLVDIIERNNQTWLTYKHERTAHPAPENDDVSPMTIKSVKIGKSSKDRIYRMFPYNEARQIVNALWKNNKTIVFTSNPDYERNIYALFEEYHVTIEQE